MISATHPLTPSCVLFLFLYSGLGSGSPSGCKRHQAIRVQWQWWAGNLTRTCGDVTLTMQMPLQQPHYPATEDTHPLSTHRQHFGLLWVHEPFRKITFHLHQKKRKKKLAVICITCAVCSLSHYWYQTVGIRQRKHKQVITEYVWLTMDSFGTGVVSFYCALYPYGF